MILIKQLDFMGGLSCVATWELAAYELLTTP